MVRRSVLVVENEPLMREAVEDILDIIEFPVIAVGNGHEGVEAYLANREDIELVILDIHLPGMDGLELLRILRTINPEVKVMVASGYDEEEIRFRLKEHQPVSFLKKPFSADTLLMLVSDLIAH